MVTNLPPGYSFADEADAPAAVPTLGLPEGYAFADEPELPAGYELVPEGQSTARNVVSQAALGAIDQGVLSGAEGVARMATTGLEDIKATVPGTEAARLRAEADALRRQNRVIEGVGYDAGGGGFGPMLTAEDEAQIAANTRRILELEERIAGRQAASTPARAAAAVAGARAAVREALPVDPEFARSLTGQIIGGLGQAAGTLPLYAVPGAGPGVTIGQMFDQGYQDAKQSGADEDTARAAGFANVPAAALDVAADRLVIGKILKPLKGRLTVGQLAASIGAGAVGEGGTEGVQQVWQNLIAKQLVGYAPERALDDEVINSIIVGAVVGGTVTAAGQAATQVAGRRRDGGPAAPGEAAAPAPAPRPAPADEAAAAFGGEAAAEAVIPAQPLSQELTSGTAAAPAQPLAPKPEVGGSTPSPATTQTAAPAPLPPDDFADITLDDIEPLAWETEAARIVAAAQEGQASQPAPVTEAGPGMSPADSVPAVAPEGAGDLSAEPQSSAVAERSGAESMPAAGTVGKPDDFALRLADWKQKAGPKGATLKLGSRSDGVFDVLDALQDLGGISRGTGGEGDGFAEAFRGKARLVVRKKAGAVDVKLAELAELGFKFDTPDALYAAVEKASQERSRLAESDRAAEDQAAFQAAALENKGRRPAGKTPTAPVDSDSLRVGDRFKIKGEPFEVVSIDPDTFDVVVRDGPRFGTQVLPASTPVFPDKKTLRRAKTPAVAADLPFARRAAKASAPDGGQSDLFAGGETGGDTLFNLQGPSIDSTIANWSLDAELDRRDAATRQAKTQTELDFAQRTADRDRTAVDRARLAELQTRWRANAERVAPGLMQSFRLTFGDPEILVRMGRADARTLTGAEQAAYLANERMFFLFDQALLREGDKIAVANLLHEMGHAHWDTLPATRQAELLTLWREETNKRTGPLYTRGRLKAGVAQGVEGSVKEWYAERIAWANHGWARARILGGEAPSAGLAGRLAQTFRQLLVKLAAYVEQLRGVTINKDFRTFLDQGERFAERAGGPRPPAPRVVVAKAPGLVSIAQRAARMGSDFAIRAFHGTPHKVDKFSTDFIGEGEGAQVYGWGLYFAQNREVAESYRKKLSSDVPPMSVLREYFKPGRIVPSYGGGRDQVIAFDEGADGNWSVTVLGVVRDGEGWKPGPYERPRAHRTYPDRRKLAAAGFNWRSGNTYTVELGVDEGDMLDWDAPLTNQSEKVQGVIKKLRPEWFQKGWHQGPRVATDPAVIAQIESTPEAERRSQNIRYGVPAEVLDGRMAYLYAAQDVAAGRDDAAASARLLAEGISGIRYLDAGSRGRLDGREVGTRNFVIFDENLVRIVAENADFARRTPAQLSQDALTGARAWLRRNLTSAAGLPGAAFEAKVAKDGRLASVAKQIEFSLRDFDRALHVVYGGYRSMSSAQLEELNNVLGGQLPLSTVDARLHAPLTTMRNHIDTLSARLVREGAVDAKVAARVSGNLGFYLNRSYRKFDDSNWAKNVPEAVRNRAETFIAAELAAQNPGQPVDPREVRGYVDYLLSKDTANESLYREPGRVGAMALDVLKARKDLPPELRELMGEYLDPRVNYLRSVAKTAQILEANRFLRDVRRAGMGKWLFSRPITDATGSYSTPLAGEGSKAMGVLAGLYTTPEIAAAFQAQTEAAPGQALRAWFALNAWAKVSKTVLSPVTQARNFFGNLAFMVAGAHWRADAAADVWRAMQAEFGVGDTPARRAYLARLARLGIVGESVNAGELREALADAGGKLQGFEKWTDTRLMRSAKLPFRAAARLYQLNDEIFKIYAFENERRRWAGIDPTLSAEQLDQVAAERVRNTLPTYSLIPKAVQAVRRAGLTGSFLSFPSEIVRVSYHSIRYALGDLAAANPRQKAAGAARLAGLIAVATLPAAVSMTSRWLAGMSADDEEDLRRFLPEWSKNAALYFTKQDGRGRFELVDASYLDPYNYLKKPLTAALRGEDWEAAIVAAGREALNPFASEGLVTKAALDLARNRDDRDRRIYNPQEPFLDRAGDQLAHVWKVYEPGLVTQARRITMAAKGEVAPGGRVYDLENEVAAVLTGARRQDLDVAQALIFRAKRYAGEKRGAELIWTEVRDNRGNVETPDLERARATMEEVRRALFDQMREDVAAAQRLGVDSGVTVRALIGAGMGMDEAARLVAGVYVPYIGQPDLRQRALADGVTARP